MKNIWSVARQTLSQCLRMKLAVAFILLLAGMLVSLPLVMRGDGTLSGGIRTVLSYSLGITGVVLSIITVFAIVSVVTDDIRKKHVMMLAVKPIARWEYMFGRWLGVVLLNVVLLAVASVSMFIVLQYLRDMTAQDAHDRQVIETEIFCARQEITPQPPDIKRLLEEKIAELRKEKRLEKILADFMEETNGDQEAAFFKMQRELAKQIITGLETIPPNRRKVWKFVGLKLDDASLTRSGKVSQMAKDMGYFHITVPDSLVAKLFLGGMVKINGIRGRVVNLDRGGFIVQFRPEDLSRAELSQLAEGSSVEVTAEPVLQFRYKAKPLSGGSDTELFRVIRFYTGQVDTAFVDAKPTGVYTAGMGPTGSVTTLTLPATNIDTNTIFVEYLNIARRPSTPMETVLPPVPVRISESSVTLLYRVGGFEANYFRGVLLILFQMMFLAALGVFCSSFLAFPVASLSCFVLLGCGMIMNWLADSLSWGPGMDVTTFVGGSMVYVVKFLMPDMSALAPASRLVEGLYISPDSVSMVFLKTVVIRAGIYLAIGCLIYHKRELAKVQV